VTISPEYDKLQMKFLQKELEKTLSKNAEHIFTLMSNLDGLNLLRPTLDSSEAIKMLDELQGFMSERKELRADLAFVENYYSKYY
jgi:hypothetical protein